MVNQARSGVSGVGIPLLRDKRAVLELHKKTPLKARPLHPLTYEVVLRDGWMRPI